VLLLPPGILDTGEALARGPKAESTWGPAPDPHVVKKPEADKEVPAAPMAGALGPVPSPSIDVCC
jgi:hypothetical protein